MNNNLFARSLVQDGDRLEMLWQQCPGLQML